MDAGRRIRHLAVVAVLLTAAAAFVATCIVERLSRHEDKWSKRWEAIAQEIGR